MSLLASSEWRSLTWVTRDLDLDIADSGVVAPAGGRRFGAVVFELLELGRPGGGGSRCRGHVHHHVVVSFLLADQRVADEAPVGSGADHDHKHHDRDDSPGGDTVRLGSDRGLLAGCRRSVSAGVLRVAQSGWHVESLWGHTAREGSRWRIAATVGRSQAAIVVETPAGAACRATSPS